MQLEGEEIYFDSTSHDTILHGRKDLAEASVHGNGSVSKALLAHGHFIKQNAFSPTSEIPKVLIGNTIQKSRVLWEAKENS